MNNESMPALEPDKTATIPKRHKQTTLFFFFVQELTDAREMDNKEICSRQIQQDYQKHRE